MIFKIKLILSNRWMVDERVLKGETTKDIEVSKGNCRRRRLTIELYVKNV